MRNAVGAAFTGISSQKCCAVLYGSRRDEPREESGHGKAPMRKFRRIHGLQLPLHPQQIVAWLVLLGVGTGTFSVLTPLLVPRIRTVVSVLIGLAFVIHILSHLTVLLLDPADPEVRSKPANSIVPEFDRTKFRRVIENGHCHLCDIATSDERTKHCSICNKCVARFDHHCKWLNNCIGGRNYPAFLACLISAIISSLIVVGLSVTELVFVSSCGIEESRRRWENNGWMDNATTVPVLPVPGTGSLIIISAIGILSAIAAVLLIHLCFFHGYIACLGLSTYEYVRSKREKSAGVGNVLFLGNSGVASRRGDSSGLELPRRYRFCEKRRSPIRKQESEIRTIESTSVYVCSNQERTGGQERNGEGVESGRDRRNFRLCFSYETGSNEASIELSTSQTTMDRRLFNTDVRYRDTVDANPLTPSPVSCCFSIMNGSSNRIAQEKRTKRSKKRSEAGDPEKEATERRSCGTIKRIQTFLRTRLRKTARRRSLDADLRNRGNKVSPIGGSEDEERDKDEGQRERQGNVSQEQDSSIPRTRPPVKLPPLDLPPGKRSKHIAAAGNGAYSLSMPMAISIKRNQSRLRPRRSSFRKRPRFRMGPRLAQSAQLSPIPESEFSKPASPRSPPRPSHFVFPPLPE